MTTLPVSDLRADCSRCAGLCCVAPAFSRSADFALDKPAGRPCPNLEHDFRCGIHDRLRDRGFAGCEVYDCFGAGQKVTGLTFAGVDWRQDPDVAPTVFAVFGVMRQLHELLWYVSAALALPAAEPAHPALTQALETTERLTRLDPAALVTLDVEAHRASVNALLQDASDLARSGKGQGVDHRGADLVGRDLRGYDLRGANLRGALLLGADLRGSDLSYADVTGTDLRSVRLDGADLHRCLFLTQAQLDAARGAVSTLLPGSLRRPAHWPGGEVR